MSKPVVEVEEGVLQGEVKKNQNDTQYYSFKGIPYAKPPVGELRFSVPVPAESWEGVRDATKECNICAQFDKATSSVVGDENCLYLNVYTPKLPADDSVLRPVMFYLHGGGFVFGNGTDASLHGPDFLIEKDVVIVIINYRVGVLGFLSLDRKEAPGNMGLRDQVQALKWVQKNIGNFGGDPNNVTIFGVSAGAASVEYLILSPMARGLFHKAISQSGSSLLHWAHNDNVKALASKIPEVKGDFIPYDDELLKYLKDLPTKELIMLSMSVIQDDKFRGGIHFGFVPTVEKPTDWEPFLSRPTYELLTKGEFMKVPYMTGLCTREGLLMVSHGMPILEKLVKEKKFLDYFPFDIDDFEKVNVEAELETTYLEGEKNSIDADAFAIDFFSDVDFLGGIYAAAILIAKNNDCPVYFYEFSYDGSLNYVKKCHGIDREGACHGDDGGYLLKCDKITGDLSDTDKMMQDMILDMWANFARHGNPTPKTDKLITTEWEPFAETGEACLVIDKNPRIKYGIYPERVNIFKRLYKKQYFGE